MFRAPAEGLAERRRRERVGLPAPSAGPALVPRRARGWGASRGRRARERQQQRQLREAAQGVPAPEGAGAERAGAQDSILDGAGTRVHDNQFRHPRECNRCLRAELPCCAVTVQMHACSVGPAGQRLRLACEPMHCLPILPTPRLAAQGSILCPAFKREIWEAATGELLHLCHEAAERRSYKTGARPPPPEELKKPELGRCEPLGSVQASVLSFLIVSIRTEFQRYQHRLSL